MSVRIGVVHALTASIPPIEAAFTAVWPEAQVVNLCDQSLYVDYERWGRETDEITRRVTALLAYSADSGAQGFGVRLLEWDPSYQVLVERLGS